MPFKYSSNCPTSSPRQLRPHGCPSRHHIEMPEPPDIYVLDHAIQYAHRIFWQAIRSRAGITTTSASAQTRLLATHGIQSAALASLGVVSPALATVAISQLLFPGWQDATVLSHVHTLLWGCPTAAGMALSRAAATRPRWRLGFWS